MAGLLYLQHTFRLSDEAVVARWTENPYYQHFTAETFFQHRPPIDPTSLIRWRKRIGEFGGLRHWFERAAERCRVVADEDHRGWPDVGRRR